MKESKFQKFFIDELKDRFPGCIVLKNDASYCQGIPDIIFLYKTKWAAFEIKNSEFAHHQPNQDYYISKMDGMSYAAFVYPENAEDILDDLEQTFKRRPRRSTRLPRS